MFLTGCVVHNQPHPDRTPGDRTGVYSQAPKAHTQHMYRSIGTRPRIRAACEGWQWIYTHTAQQNPLQVCTEVDSHSFHHCHHRWREGGVHVKPLLSPRGCHGTCQRHRLGVISWEIYTCQPRKRPRCDQACCHSHCSALPRHPRARECEQEQRLVHLLIPVPSSGPGTKQMLVNERLAE